MRKCEKCDGPGPCLYDNPTQQYVCVKCHSCPDDPFFARGKLANTIERGEHREEE